MGGSASGPIVADTVDCKIITCFGGEYNNESDLYIYQSETKPIITEVRDSMKKKPHYWPKEAIWIDRERVAHMPAAERKAYEAKHGQAAWVSSWMAACDNASVALIFVSEKSLGSKHCKMEIEHIFNTCSDPRNDVFFIAVDQKAKTYEFIDEKKAQGFHAFKRGEHSGPGGAIDAICIRAERI